ncbi:uncharacterized protein [Ptychodera flava]|uniref:uncharacterized protein n=1 Tax=Ptychodera flava TaxID=63121 RepID=UPI00396A02E2
MISKLLESMEKIYISTSLYGKDDIKEQRTLMLFAADDETRFYQLPSGFTLEVPPFAVEEDSELVVSCYQKNRPPLEDFQCYQSDLLDVKTNDAKFKRPVYLLRKHLNIDSLIRVQIILISKNGDEWKELKNVENQSVKNTRVEVTHFCKVIAISEPYRDTFSVSKNSEIFTCKRNEQIQLEIPEDAVDDRQVVTLEVHECGYNTLDTAIPTGGEAFDISFGSIIYLNRKMAEHLTFKKYVTLSIPLPQPIPGVHPSNTELCVLKDEADNDEWQNITEHCSWDIENDMLKLKIKSISGYVVGRYIKDIMPRMCNLLSKITKFKKSGQHMVQIVLLQDKAVDTRLQCHLMEDRGREIEDLLKSDEYTAFKNYTYWSNILMTSGDVITNTVTGDFKLLSVINKYTYYPYRDNHWDALVEPKDTCQKSVMIGQMVFSRKEENLAELTFTTKSERLVKEDKIERDYTSLSDLNCLFIDMEKALKKDQERKLRGLLRGDKIPSRQLQNMDGPLDIFEYLLDNNHIEKGNLKLLEEVFHKIGSNQLVRMVKDYQQCVRSRVSKET